MADSDLIARVYPVGEATRTETLKYATHSITCNRRSRPALRTSAPRTQPTRGAREATEPLEGANADAQQEDLNSLPYLELTFSDGPRASTGFVFGKDPDASDVVLPSIPGISRQHFSLTYKNTFEDGRYRLVVRDLGSLRGTTVTYNAKGEHLRRKFDWIIAGFEFPNQAKSIIIQLHDDVKFRIVVAHHDVASPAYISNVERFLQGAAQSDALLGALRLQSGPHTERATAAHTPTNAPVFVNRGVIARGKFGTVSHRWNVSTGEEYGCKKPTERHFSRADWQKEISIMKGVHHSHIVRLCFSTMSPEPRLYLEYMSFGNLLNEFERVPYSFEECCHILRQSLSALDYLHGQPEPIAHRDLKPQNILVKSREPLHIKLADFGLAKAGHLETHCGTLTYSPPELQSDSRSHRHTVAVDMWSLGVVILQFGYGLPSPGYGSEMSWCIEIAEEASRCELDGLIEILQRMLMLEANARDSAATCLGLAQALCGWTQVPGGSAEGNEAVSWPSGLSSQGDMLAAASSSPGSEGSDDDETVILEPTNARRHSRSGAPSPASRRPGRVRRSSKSYGRGHPPVSGRRLSTHRRHSRAAEHAEQTARGLGARRRDTLEALIPGSPRHDDDPGEGASMCARPLEAQLNRPVASFADESHDQLGEPRTSSGPPLASFNTWTRDVLCDRPGMVRMVIRCCSISMRTLDHWLNASEILLASELSRATRNRYLHELNRRGFRAEGRLPVWVPFQDGVFVCQAAGLEDELEPLLSVAALVRPLRVENYLLLLPDDVFEVLDTGDGKIAYKPTARHVNAAHLGKLYNIQHHKLSQFFSDHPHIDKQVKRGSPGHLQGSYISFEDARVLCAHFKVSYRPVERLIALLSAPVAGAHNSAPSAPAALSAPDPPGVSETAKEAIYDAHTSYITEPSYANGSYLVPAAGSRLAPRNLQSCLAPSPASGTPHGLAREFESERSGYSSWSAGLDSA